MIFMDKEKLLKTIADNIRFERFRNNYTQEYLAEMAGITQKYLSLIESRKVNPSVVIVYNIAHALNMDINSICKDNNLNLK